MYRIRRFDCILKTFPGGKVLLKFYWNFTNISPKLFFVLDYFSIKFQENFSEILVNIAEISEE